MKGDQFKKAQAEKDEMMQRLGAALQEVKSLRGALGDQEKYKWSMEAAVSLVTSKAIVFDVNSEKVFAEKLGNLMRGIAKEISPKESIVKTL